MKNSTQKKILFIEPPFYRLFKDTYSLDRYPLSLGYLAGTVKQEMDWQVKVYNGDFNPVNEGMTLGYVADEGYKNYLSNLKDPTGAIWDGVRAVVREFEPDVVGITVKSQNFAAGCIVAEIVKTANDKTVVIAGGPHVSMAGADAMKYETIDIVARGEGEQTIVEILKAIESGGELSEITGIMYRKDGEIATNGPREFIQDLDKLCYPHESASEVLIDYEKYPPEAFKNIFTIRGCPNNCYFCGSRQIWSRKVRFRSIDNIIREIKGLAKMGVVRNLRFDDDTFGVSKKRIFELCEAIVEHCPDLTWECELHVKLVDDETITIMRKAGCMSIQLGIESGNNDILKQMRKNITIEEALAACKVIKQHGIMLQAFFIVGFPQETEQTVADTVAAMKKTSCDHLVYSVFTPYPGTESFEYCKEHGIIDDDFDISLYNHNSPANCFCMNIPRERFQQLRSKIEKMVDRKNYLNGVKKIFSLQALKRMREKGLAGSMQTGIKLLTGK